jgi:predicted PurR-regulated permease PerM
MAITDTTEPHDGERMRPAQGFALHAAVTSSIAVALTASAVALAFVLIKAQGIVLTVFGAIVIAEAVRPLVGRLSARVPRVAAIAIVFAVLLAAFAFVWWAALRELAPQFAAFGRAFPGYVSTVFHFVEHVKGQLPVQIVNAASQTANSPVGPILNALAGAGIGVFSFIGTMALALLLAIFWLDASDPLRAFVLTIVRKESRSEADTLFRDLGKQLAQYAVGTIVNGAIVAAASVAALLLLRAPYPLVLGALQGLLIALPYVGTLIGVLTVGAVVLGEQGPAHAAVAVAVISVIATVEGSFISPRIFKETLNLDPFSTTLAVAIGGTLFGTGGIVLAVPAAAVLQTLAVRVVAPAIRRAQR